MVEIAILYRFWAPVVVEIAIIKRFWVPVVVEIAISQRFWVKARIRSAVYLQEKNSGTNHDHPRKVVIEIVVL